jgi:SLAP domain-containing protein
MKKKGKKKLMSLLLALAMVFATLATGAEPVAAASEDYTETDVASDYGYAYAGEEVLIPFTVTQNMGFYGTLIVEAPVSIQIALYDSTGSLVTDTDGIHDGYSNPTTLSTDDFIYSSSYEVYGYIDLWDGSLPAGDYSYGLTFASDAEYLFGVTQFSNPAKLSQTSATITKGFSKKLSVSNGKVKKWSSKNSKIAKVDSKGKVTGVKKGSTTITATLTDGTKLTCKVKVKDNKYSDTKPTLSDVDYGDVVLFPYSASYDSKGNLSIKVRVLNKTSAKVIRLDNVKLTVKNPSGKTVGVYKCSKKTVSISAYSTKDYTFTIKKSSLKIKSKQDLRNSTVDFDNSASQYMYTY